MSSPLLALAVVAAAALCGAVCGAAPDGLLFGDDPRRPPEVTPEVVCHACRAVVDEVRVAVPPARTRASVADVYEAVGGACDQARLRRYKFIPPTMVAGCHRFMDEHGDGLEEAIWGARSLGDEAAGARVCAAACRGVDFVSVADEAGAKRARFDAEGGQQQKKMKKKKGGGGAKGGARRGGGKAPASGEAGGGEL